MKLFGNWRPGNFNPWVTFGIKLTIFVAVMVRGMDYASGDSADTARRLQLIEEAAPLWTWGWACIIIASIGFLGLMLKWGHLILIALIGSFALYSSLSMGILMDVIDRADEPTKGLPMSLAFFIVSALMLLISISHEGRFNRIFWISTSALFFSLSVGSFSLGLDGLRSSTLTLWMAVISLLMAIGVASRITQEQILREREISAR